MTFLELLGRLEKSSLQGKDFVTRGERGERMQQRSIMCSASYPNYLSSDPEHDWNRMARGMEPLEEREAESARIWYVYAKTPRKLARKCTSEGRGSIPDAQSAVFP